MKHWGYRKLVVRMDGWMKWARSLALGPLAFISYCNCTNEHSNVAITVQYSMEAKLRARDSAEYHSSTVSFISKHFNPTRLSATRTRRTEESGPSQGAAMCRKSDRARSHHIIPVSYLFSLKKNTRSCLRARLRELRSRVLQGSGEEAKKRAARGGR